jgi:hypothetical protein
MLRIWRKDAIKLRRKTPSCVKNSQKPETASQIQQYWCPRRCVFFDSSIPLNGLITILKVAASSELMHHLSLTKDALDKFNRLVFSNSQGTNRAESTLSEHAVLPSASYHPGSATPSSFASPNSLSRNDNRSRRRKELYVDDSHPPHSPQSPSTSVTSPGLASDTNDVCCGGIFDCDEFCGGEEEQPNSTQRETSGLRSTNHDP